MENYDVIAEDTNELLTNIVFLGGITSAAAIVVKAVSHLPTLPTLSWKFSFALGLIPGALVWSYCKNN
jgi:hypothetical protein